VGEIILKRNTFGGCELDISGSGKAKLAGCCDGGNKFSVYVGFVKLFSYLRNYQCFKKGSAWWS
jgi:hypothetical protein